MFCRNCGRKVPDGAKFCPGCGTSLQEPEEKKDLEPSQPEEPATAVPSDLVEEIRSQVEGALEPEAETPQSIEDEIFHAIMPGEEGTGTDGAEGTPEAADDQALSAPEEADASEKTKKCPLGRKGMIALAVAAALVLLAGAGWLIHHFVGDKEYREDLKRAESYLEEEEYEDAIEAYQAALERKPGDPEASMGLARIYLLQGDYEAAQDVLEQVKGGSKKELKNLKAAVELAPEVQEVDTETFPVVAVELACQGKAKLGEVQVLEGGEERRVLDTIAKQDHVTILYETEPVDDEAEDRDLEMRLTVGDFVLGLSTQYEAPRLEEARVELVSTDVSHYPTVRAYFRVVDAENLETIPELTARSFQIRERLSGGKYVSREVHSAAPLEGKYGLNIDLVADKSDSISDTDMEKIQKVMTEFVSSLHYQDGDQAEVLAFDSIVQQMCCYTKDQNLLVNGIRNMSTDGMTALYDALYMGVENAALQGGARCVIGFTDGIDNSSSHSSSEVISRAVEKQVPVYIIGVSSSVEENELRQVAEGTGGRYWFIDDLSDLEEIFAEIYAQQKKLYVVEYESDGEDPYVQRDLEVSVSGGGYYGEGESSFQAGETVQGKTHSSRYELVKESLSWEEARRRCQEMGGHLATITSQQEMDQLTKMASDQGIKFLWLGGYTSYDSQGNVFGHWITGEDFSFQRWAPEEPSRVDLDGEPEWYIMLWNVEKLGGWSWNDQRNDPAAAVKTMAPEMGFICEYES